MRRPRRRSAACVLAAGVIALVACSWSTDFVVVNRTAGPVTVVYWLADRPTHRCCPPATQLPPLLVPADSLRPRANHWLAAETPAFAYDPATRAVTVTVPPGDALRAGREGTYHGDVADLPIDSVRATASPDGQVLLAGSAARAFRRVSDQLYVLTLRAPGEPSPWRERVARWRTWLWGRGR